MKNRSGNVFIALAMLALLTLNLQLSTAHAQGTAFTYQGQLQTSNGPANGAYNLQFTLYTNSVGSGSSVAGPVTNNAVAVTNGLFTVVMDFGSGPWNGRTNWLQIAVETNSASATFTTLTPLQELTPVPYSIYAESGGTLASGVALGTGSGNSVAGGVSDSFIGGGFRNNIQSGANYATIGGGDVNFANGLEATVSGGTSNTASA